MAIDEALHAELLTALEASDWTVALQAVRLADARLRGTIVGDREGDELVAKLVTLANHPKWEVRRAVANVAGQAPHPAFQQVLARFAVDDNQQVRQAAEHAAVRRRDSRHASTLGKQHEERIHATLDEIETRFGPKGRAAVTRAAEHIANMYARELYHEAIKLLSPLVTSAERLRTQLSAPEVSSEQLSREAERIGQRARRVRDVLDGMRAYTEQPALSFTVESVRDVVQEAVNVALESDANASLRLPIEVRVPADLVAGVARVRLVQALTNVLLNAIESYEGVDSRKPIVVTAEARGGLLGVTVTDSGCGMSEEVQGDALTLFASHKKNGTGFGLPLAVKIVESEHGGRLTIESAEGRGTSIRITIPWDRA
ncbi:MAG TPA: ATP-binding protein [Thermoanaerobaculia bacterium]|nr:ATP-binding protein [Thermoanaerobaculia bacterium]